MYQNKSQDIYFQNSILLQLVMFDILIFSKSFLNGRVGARRAGSGDTAQQAVAAILIDVRSVQRKLLVHEVCPRAFHDRWKPEVRLRRHRVRGKPSFGGEEEYGVIVLPAITLLHRSSHKKREKADGEARTMTAFAIFFISYGRLRCRYHGRLRWVAGGTGGFIATSSTGQKASGCRIPNNHKCPLLTLVMTDSHRFSRFGKEWIFSVNGFFFYKFNINAYLP